MTGRIRTIFVKSFREAEEAAGRHFNPETPGRAGFKVIVVCLTAALCLTMVARYGSAGSLHALIRGMGKGNTAGWINDNLRLAGLLWWAGMVITFYLIVPGIVVKGVFRERLGDYGFRLTGTLEDRSLYMLLMLVMMPVVLLVSGDAAFQARYPFYKLSAGEGLWPSFAIWEAAYLMQFVAVEFFFRGFLLHGTKDRLGFYSIFAMTIPYCMVHFGKPLPEILASIIAGVVLGVFSLKSRSILPGCLLHGGTALTMDLAALWRKGLLFPSMVDGFPPGP